MPLVMVATVILSLGAASANDNPPPPSIAVTGQGVISSPPDLAIVTFGVETTALEASDAIDENARKSSRLTAAIKEALGPTDTVATTRYSLAPVYDHRRDRAANEPPTITGYIARNEVRVETAKLDEIGKLIDRAAAAGANRINRLTFVLDDQDEARSRALAKAARHARHEGQVIADALGIKLGRVLQANSSSSPAVPPRLYQGAAMAMESRVAPPVDPGDIQVRASVHVTFAID